MPAVAGSKGKSIFLKLAGEAGMTHNAFNLRQLRLTEPGRRGSLTGGGTVTLTATGDPPCRKSTPACMQPSRLFTVTIEISK